MTTPYNKSKNNHPRHLALLISREINLSLKNTTQTHILHFGININALLYVDIN